MKEAIKYLGIGGAIVVGLLSFGWFIGWLLPNSMTNQQIVEQTKYCESNGMKANQIINGFTYDVVKVICKNKEK